MIKNLKFAILTVLIAFSFQGVAFAGCQGKFPNFFSDICWDCAFPIKLFGMQISDKSGEDFESTNFTGAQKLSCSCTDGMTTKLGFPISFWEFARQVDVTRHPYCMVSMGMEMGIDINAQSKGSSAAPNKATGGRQFFRHSHVYINPVMGLMEIALDSKCLEPKGFDVFYMSEVDPTWMDEEMALILTPDAYLFTNIASQLVCAGDCVAASTGLNAMSNYLFWCAGCNGTLYPMTGFVDNVYGGVQMSSLMAQRIMAKMHRTLLVPTTSGPSGMCNVGMPEVTMDKRIYKHSMLYPVAQATPNESTVGTGGILACCQPFGRTTVTWGAMRELPGNGEDFAYGIFRKRDCCQTK